MTNVLSAVLEITHECNYNCYHCYVQNKTEQSMSVKRWIFLLDELATEGCLTLIISGGEIFTRRDLLYDILKKASEINFNIVLITNGELVTEKDCYKLKDYGVDKIIVSLYGYNDNTINATTRTHVPSHKVFRNLSFMQKVGLNIETQSVAVKSNVCDIKFIRQWTDAQNIKYGVEGYVFTAQDCKRNVLCAIDNNDICRISSELIKTDIVEKKREKNAKVCAAGTNKICITPGGDVLPCPTWRKQLDNISNQSLHNALAQIRGERAYMFGDLGECMQCDCFYKCNICPGINYQDTGNPLVPSKRYCAYEKQIWSKL